jgi:hypothetical protein
LAVVFSTPLAIPPPNSFRHAFGVTPHLRGRLGLRRFAPEGTRGIPAFAGMTTAMESAKATANRTPVYQGNDGFFFVFRRVRRVRRGYRFSLLSFAVFAGTPV